MNEKQQNDKRTRDRWRSAAFIATELIGASAVTVGVALVSVPAAFIVGGILLIVGSEFAA
jgi:hypothetical protein